jgi:hypothetical protein
VTSRVHDHTSILKLIEEKWNLTALTRRDAAESPLDALNLEAPPAFATPPRPPAPKLRWVPGKWQLIAILPIIEWLDNNGLMSPAVNISAELSPGDRLPLVAEVVSPGSATDDRVTKKRIYALGQVPLYLLVDVDTVTLFSDPDGGSYRSQATVTIGEKLTLPEPFGIELDTRILNCALCPISSKTKMSVLDATLPLTRTVASAGNGRR